MLFALVSSALCYSVLTIEVCDYTNKPDCVKWDEAIKQVEAATDDQIILKNANGEEGTIRYKNDVGLISLIGFWRCKVEIYVNGVVGITTCMYSWLRTHLPELFIHLSIRFSSFFI